MIADPILLNLGNRLKELRITKGIAQAELAEITKLDLQVIQNLETGRRETDILEIDRIARALGISTDILLSGLE